MLQRKTKQQKAQLINGKCMDCVFCYEPHSLSIYGVPTLAKCKFEKWGVLYQRVCRNGHFKPKTDEAENP